MNILEARQLVALVMSRYKGSYARAEEGSPACWVLASVRVGKVPRLFRLYSEANIELIETAIEDEAAIASIWRVAKGEES